MLHLASVRNDAHGVHFSEGDSPYALELFEKTVDGAIAADPRLKLIINGSYGDNHTISLGWAKYTQSGPINPNEQTIMGEVVENKVKTVGIAKGRRAYFAFDHTLRVQGAVHVNVHQEDPCYFGIGKPPAVDAALGGLGPLLIKNKEFDDGDDFYRGLNSYLPATGGIGIASSRRWSSPFEPHGLHDALLVFAQPHGTNPGLSIDRLRAKLGDAGFDNAVLLDGSNSVMLTRDGVRRIKQGPFKNRITSVGLGFYYDSNLSLPW